MFIPHVTLLHSFRESEPDLFCTREFTQQRSQDEYQTEESNIRHI